MRRFHRWPHPLHMLWISLGMGYISVLAAFPPDKLPFQSLPQSFQTWSSDLATNHPLLILRLVTAAWVIHAVEAIVAFFVAKAKGLHPSDISSWVLSSFLFGIFSMIHLIRYTPGDEQKKRRDWQKPPVGASKKVN